MVAEADESDGSFTNIHPKIAVVTNMDAEHMEHYKNLDNLRQAYENFVMNTPADTGVVVCGIDHHEVAALAGRVSDRKVVTYGLLPEAHISADNIMQKGAAMGFDVLIEGKRYAGFRINMPGRHNVLNALAAIAVGIECGVDLETIKKGLMSFKGVGRRFIRIGDAYGAMVIDDYAHHPVEIESTIKGTKGGFANNKVVAVIQPHRFTRLNDLMDEFAACAMDADEVIVTPVYSAGEKPIPNVNREELAKRMRANRIQNVHVVKDPEEFNSLVQTLVTNGDIILCMGAGNINTWGQFIVQQSKLKS